MDLFLELHLENVPLLFKAQTFKKWPGLTSAATQEGKTDLSQVILLSAAIQNYSVGITIGGVSISSHALFSR